MIDAGGGEFLEGIVFHSTPGHSIDHFSISIESRGNHARHAADRKAIVFSSHFPGTAAGRIERPGENFTWKFA